MMILEDYLRRHAEERPSKKAVVCGEEALTYSQLYERAAAMAARLRLSAGKAHVFRATQDADFLVTYFAAHLAGKVAVPLEKDTPETIFGDVRRMVEEATVPDGVADILFTTGTTGRQKGVMISNETIVADAENLIASQGYASDLTFVVSGPLNHIGSLSKLYPMIYLGGTICITEGMKDVNALLGAIERAEGKTATFLVPASIRILMQFAGDSLRRLARKIDFIETGAAPISQGDMERLCVMLPYSRLYNTYASTETGIIATYDFSGGECVAGCLGRPMRHSGIRIDDDGRIECTGKTLMMGYVGDAELTASVLFDGAVHTADIGELDAEGRLHLSGRDGDVINVGGYKVAPTEVEDVAMACDGVADCVCVSASHPVLGTVLKLIVVPSHGSSFEKRRIALYLKERLEAYKIPFFYEKADSVRRTYNGKIDRKSYR